ncbi:MAG: hypothetical protein U5J96_04455 [Ignavibacteriaceae bacterium]|nr:hypothetical protein [Ignavibacteriaceae bacterium]
MRKRVNEYSGGYLPIIITGDFNFDENADGYKILTSGELEMEDLISSIEYDSLLNSQHISEKPHYGGKITFNAFGKKTDIESPIDFIFVNKYVKVLSHRVIADTLEGLYTSDHFPVLVDIHLKR